MHPLIPNPEYVPDETLYHRCTDCAYFGFELWQVKSGTIFDDIIVTDSVEDAKAFAGETWGARKDKEREMFDKHEAEVKAKEDERREKEREDREKEEREKLKEMAKEDSKKKGDADESDDDWVSC